MKSTDDIAIATPEQRRALRRNIQQRLRDQAEFLVRAIEDLDPPKTPAEAEKAAKAIQAVATVVDLVFKTQADDDRFDYRNLPSFEEERQALTSWQAVLDDRFVRFALARKARDDAET